MTTLEIIFLVSLVVLCLVFVIYVAKLNDEIEVLHRLLSIQEKISGCLFSRCEAYRERVEVLEKIVKESAYDTGREDS